MPVYLLTRHGCLGVQGVHTAGKERNPGYPWDTFYQSLIETNFSKKDPGVVICRLLHATSKRQPEQHCVPTQSCVCAALRSAAAAANVFFWECQPTPRQN